QRKNQSCQSKNKSCLISSALDKKHSELLTYEHLSAGLKQQAMFTCECCGRTSTTKGYLVVDHIIPRKIDKRKQLDKDNLWVICKRCHWYKGLLEDDVYTDGLSIENIDARQTSHTNV
ncbi:HNH endonuclease, partial [Leuconostoc citreum]|uniref:HNH endonuclease n=1 Tax=Leuconostoc citreum TaxID=33964 RepID=UPI0021A2F0E5